MPHIAHPWNPRQRPAPRARSRLTGVAAPPQAAVAQGHGILRQSVTWKPNGVEHIDRTHRSMGETHNPKKTTDRCRDGKGVSCGFSLKPVLRMITGSGAFESTMREDSSCLTGEGLKRLKGQSSMESKHMGSVFFQKKYGQSKRARATHFYLK